MRIIGQIAAAVLVAGATACGGSDEAVEAVAPARVQRAASNATNHAPVIRSVRLDPADPIDGDRVHAIVSVADEDGDSVELGFEWQISGRPVSTGESSIDLRGVTKRDRVEVTVKASDGSLMSDTVRAEVRIRNRRPTLVGLALKPQLEVLPGEQLVATAKANDPDRDSITYRYRWRINGKSQFGTENTFETDDLVKGDEIQVFAIANDGTLDSEELESAIVRVGNTHPEIVSVPGNNWTDDVFNYKVEAHDPDNEGPLRYALKEGPKGMRVDSVVGKVVWQPTADQAGVHPIAIEVSDVGGATSVQKFEITVRTEERAAPPASAQR